MHKESLTLLEVPVLGDPFKHHKAQAISPAEQNYEETEQVMRTIKTFKEPVTHRPHKAKPTTSNHLKNSALFIKKQIIKKWDTGSIGIQPPRQGLDPPKVGDCPPLSTHVNWEAGPNRCSQSKQIPMAHFWEEGFKRKNLHLRDSIEIHGLHQPLKPVSVCGLPPGITKVSDHMGWVPPDQWHMVVTGS